MRIFSQICKSQLNIRCGYTDRSCSYDGEDSGLNPADPAPSVPAPAATSNSATNVATTEPIKRENDGEYNGTSDVHVTDNGAYAGNTAKADEYQDDQMQDMNSWQDDQNPQDHGNQRHTEEADYDRPVHLKEDG